VHVEWTPILNYIKRSQCSYATSKTLVYRTHTVYSSLPKCAIVASSSSLHLQQEWKQDMFREDEFSSWHDFLVGLLKKQVHITRESTLLIVSTGQPIVIVATCPCRRSWGRRDPRNFLSSISQNHRCANRNLRWIPECAWPRDLGLTSSYACNDIQSGIRWINMKAIE
jgi:hypothetical protein